MRKSYRECSDVLKESKRIKDGRSKKLKTPSEELYQGKADAKRFAEGGNIPKKAIGGDLRNTMTRIRPYGRPGRPEDYGIARMQNVTPSSQPTQVRPDVSAKTGKWIQTAIKHPGALKAELGIPKDKRIPAKTLHRAEHSTNPTIAKRARLAETLRTFHHRSPKR
jgi:hypothetical protein